MTFSLSATKSFKSKLRNRELCFGAWMSFDHPSLADLISCADVDFIGLDMEHAPISLASAQELISRIQGHGKAALPRPVSQSNDYIKPLLDSGASGVILPLVSTFEQSVNISNAVFFPPNGHRTYGINRAHDYGLNSNSYFNDWNDSGVLIVQVENRFGVDNIDEILGNKYIDAVMIGPYDISGSYGCPGDLDNPLVRDAVSRILTACNDAGVSCGTQLSSANDQSITKAIDLGYKFIILESDLFTMKNWVETVNYTLSSLL